MPRKAGRTSDHAVNGPVAVGHRPGGGDRPPSRHCKALSGIPGGVLRTHSKAEGMRQTESLMTRVEAGIRQLTSPEEGVAARAAHEHMAAGGARVRARLTLDAALALRCPPDVGVALAVACELLHNASLVHDDVQDRDAWRRGRPSVWSRHGAGVAICTGDLMLSAAYAALAGAGSRAPLLVRHAHAAVAAAVAGQCAATSPGDVAAVDLPAYEAIAAGKSGALLGLPLELALVAAGLGAQVPHARAAARRFAIGYQMADDIDDADIDAATGSLNAVALLGRDGHEAPADGVRDLALAHLAAAVLLAEGLPSGIGTLLAARAAALAVALHRPAMRDALSA